MRDIFYRLIEGVLVIVLVWLIMFAFKADKQEKACRAQGGLYHEGICYGVVKIIPLPESK